ncbi:MAG: DNA repair protein RecN [Firmicutes bacterium]|nr:DNA repair protein RecN [Bacillota bacterium]
MLLEVTVKNFAIIEQVTMRFEPGLNVITGETGAGKSIIVDAVNLLLGGRASIDMIRESAEKSVLEGVFECPRVEGLTELLDEMGIEDAEDEPLILSREISRGGRNICRINGRTTTLNQFRALGQYLIDLHGQQEQQSLLSLERQLALLDSFAGEEAAVLKEPLKRQFQELNQTRRQLDQLKSSERDAARMTDLLSYQVEEIRAASIRTGEEAELMEEKNLLQHAERLSRGADQAYERLYGGEHSGSAFDFISQAAAEVRQMAQIDESLRGILENCENVLVLVEENARQIRKYGERLETDPRRMEAVEERLALIHQLKRKYGESEAEIIGFGEEAQRQLDKLNRQDALLAELEEKLLKLKDGYLDTAQRLTRVREDAARRLQKAMAEEFSNLLMPEMAFEVRIAEKEWTGSGIDEIEFLISPNPGEPMKPLARIASGGETSRIMLALKTILARVDRMPTLIFDEIDSGIGGRALEAVASRLRRVADDCQVVCVTHSPQIAGRADFHLLIDKKVEAGRTRTQVSELEEAERVQEIARMLDGGAVSDLTIRHAEEMLKKRR